MPVLLPRPTSQREDLQAISSFFEIAPTGKEMVRITGASPSILGRIVQGEESDKYRPHMARVAAFCRELQEALANMTGSDAAQDESMRGWLYAGKVQTTHYGVQTPWDALANSEMAQEALHELRRSVGSL